LPSIGGLDDRRHERRRTRARLGSPPRFPAPGEQLLRGYPVSPRDFGNDSARSQRGFDRSRLLVLRPTPSASAAGDDFNPTPRGGLRLKLTIRSGHKPIPKSGPQPRSLPRQIEGVLKTSVTVGGFVRA